ncbi:MAG: RAD55 family ATPase [Kiritimatiellae bacterium]|nr:RAD55 family ATPase [Kiritimatiellia bacterium]
MVIDKTKLGLAFFDECLGGVYRGRPVLYWGSRRSGKSILACHFLNQALLEGDKALLLSRYQAQDTVIVAESLGMPFADAVNSGQLTILEYNTFITESGTSNNVMLPPQSFMELHGIVESQSIRRIAFDPVLPWVAIQPITRIAEHVYSFIHALERLDATSLLLLPKPASNAAHTLKNRLEDLCPVVIHLAHTHDRCRILRVTKYLGESSKLSTPFPFVILPGVGITTDPAPCPCSGLSDEPQPQQIRQNPAAAPATAASPRAPSLAAAAAIPAGSPKRPIHFSSVVQLP